MRTTVTIDPDTEALLREEVRRTGRSFKEVLNQAVQRGLGRGDSGKPASVVPLFTRPFSAELEAVGFNRLADAWDDEETMRELLR